MWRLSHAEVRDSHRVRMQHELSPEVWLDDEGCDQYHRQRPASSTLNLDTSSRQQCVA